MLVLERILGHDEARIGPEDSLHLSAGNRMHDVDANREVVLDPIDGPLECPVDRPDVLLIRIRSAHPSSPRETSMLPKPSAFVVDLSPLYHAVLSYECP